MSSISPVLPGQGGYREIAQSKDRSRADEGAQEVEHLPCKCEVLDSSPNTAKRKKKDTKWR
jgi:hypothetical protein